MALTEIPTALRWKTTKSEFLNAIEEQYWHLYSDYVEIVDNACIRYRLEMRPCEEDGNQIMLEMHMVVRSKTNVHYKTSIPSTHFVSQNNVELVNEYSYTEVKICSLEEFIDPNNNYFVNDTLIITMEATLRCEKEEFDFIKVPVSTFATARYDIPNVVYEKVPVENENLTVSRNLGSMLWNRNDKDFAFVTPGGKEIMVHKFIISECHVFDRMLESGMTESNENKVVITDFSFGIIEIALKYFYGIEIRNLLTVGRAFDLIKFADKYDIKDLKASVEKFISSEINAMNACKIANFSILFSKNLRAECFEFLLECNQKKIFVKDLEILDKTFAFELMKASFFK